MNKEKIIKISKLFFDYIDRHRSDLDKNKMRKAIKLIYNIFREDNFTYYNDKIKDVLFHEINLEQFDTKNKCEYWINNTINEIFKERFPNKQIVSTKFPARRFAQQSSEYYIIKSEKKDYFLKVVGFHEFNDYIKIKNILKYLNLPSQPKLMIPKDFLRCHEKDGIPGSTFFSRPLKRSVIITEVAKGEPLAQYFVDFMRNDITKDDMIKILLDVNRANAEFHKFFLRKSKYEKIITIYHDDFNSGNIFYERESKEVSWIDFSGMYKLLSAYYIDLFNLEEKSNTFDKKNLIKFFPAIIQPNIPIRGLSDDPDVYKICLKTYLDEFKDHPLYVDAIESLKPEIKEIYLS